MRGRSAVLVGASGLVGKQLLLQLLASDRYAKVHVLVRKPLAIKHSHLSEQVIDFETLEKVRLPNVDEAFCCLGTTIKVAGSKDSFRRVDHDYVLAFASNARSACAQHFVMVSAMAANAQSGVFYNRVKGEVEASVSQLGYVSVSIMRPSLLAGERSEYRLGERIAQTLAGPFSGLIPARYRPVADVSVAAAMMDAAVRGKAGVEVIESDRIQRFAQR
jgi:uncharacterized protein YbjT (DUF2867 family)